MTPQWWDIIEQSADLWSHHSWKRHGGQFIASVVQIWEEKRGIKMAYIDPGKPWQNGSAESFVGTYGKEVLNAEVFRSLKEAEVISQEWKRMYNEERPYSKLGYRTPSTAYSDEHEQFTTYLNLKLDRKSRTTHQHSWTMLHRSCAPPAVNPLPFFEGQHHDHNENGL